MKIQWSNNNNISTISLGIIFVAVAISIIIPYIFGLSYLIIGFSILFLIIGFWYFFLGISTCMTNQSEFTFGPDKSTYLMSWGLIILITGFTLLLYWYYPEESLLIFIAIFVLLLGVILLLVSILSKNRRL